MINADNYKGLFYKEKKTTKFYEGGAHFKYQDLVFVLNNLLKKNNTINNSNNSIYSKNSKISNISSLRRDSSNSFKIEKKHNNFINIKFNTLDYDNDLKNRINDRNNSKFKPKKKLYIHLVTETNPKDFATINSLSVKKIRKNPFENKNNLPLIQSPYFNNLSKKILLNKNIDSNILKYKNNLFSPIKEFELSKTKNSKAKLYNEAMQKMMEKNQLASIEVIKNFEHKDNCIVKSFMDNMQKKEKNFKFSTKTLELKRNSNKDKKIVLTNLNL